MFAVYAERPNLEDPLASLVVGECPEGEVPKPTRQTAETIKKQDRQRDSAKS